MAEDTKVEHRPGYKTTEFWLSALVTIAGLVLASGFVAEGSQLAQIIGFVLSTLSSLGYTASRGTVKAAEVKAVEQK